MYTITHKARRPFHRPEYSFDFRKRGQDWEYLGEWISAVEPEGYGWDPAIIKAIRKFDPYFVPIWVKTAYRSPAGTIHTFGRHGFARSVPVTEAKHREVRCWVPAYGINAGRKPNVFVGVHEDRSNPPVPELGVGGFLPFNWDTYEMLRVAWQTQRSADEAEKDALAMQAAEEARTTKIKKSVQDEADYRFQQEMPTIKKCVDNLTNAEFDQVTRTVKGAA